MITLVYFDDFIAVYVGNVLECHGSDLEGFQVLVQGIKIAADAYEMPLRRYTCGDPEITAGVHAGINPPLHLDEFETWPV